MSELRQSEFARTIGVTPAAITRMLKAKKLVLTPQGMIDTENELTVKYLQWRSTRPSARVIPVPAPKPQKPFADFTDRDIADYTGIPQHLVGLSLRELVKRYKGIEGVERYVKLLRDLTVTDEKEQKVRERRLQLVEKDFMVAHVFQYLDTLMTQLLEWPAAVSDELVALVQAKGGAARIEVQEKIAAGLTRIIKGAKEHILSEMSSLRPKYGEKDRETDRVSERLEAIEEALGA